MEFSHLGKRKIRKRQAGSDVEGRLVDVLNKQVRFGRIRHCQREPRPKPVRVKGAAIVPRAQQPEHFGSKRKLEQSVYLIQSPHERRVDFRQGHIAEKAFQIAVGTAARIPVGFRVGLQIQLIGNILREYPVQRVERIHCRIRQTGKIRQDHPRPALPRPLQSPRQQGCFPDLPRSLHQNDAVPPPNRLLKLPIRRPHNVKRRIQRNRAAVGFQK